MDMDWVGYWLNTGMMGISLAIVVGLTWWALRTVAEYRRYVFALRKQVVSLELELVATRRRKSCPSCLGLRDGTPYSAASLPTQAPPKR